jgi:hypothetical protein
MIKNIEVFSNYQKNFRTKNPFYFILKKSRIKMETK